MDKPCNEELREAMLDCSDAFLPDRDALESRIRSVRTIEEMESETDEILRDLTEYGAIASAVGLRKAAGKPLADQLAAVDAAHESGIGAPGDWGYGSERGKTWYACLRAADKAGKEVRHV